MNGNIYCKINYVNDMPKGDYILYESNGEIKKYKFID